MVGRESIPALALVSDAMFAPRIANEKKIEDGKKEVLDMEAQLEGPYIALQIAFNEARVLHERVVPFLMELDARAKLFVPGVLNDDFDLNLVGHPHNGFDSTDIEDLGKNTQWLIENTTSPSEIVVASSDVRKNVVQAISDWTPGRAVKAFVWAYQAYAKGRSDLFEKHAELQVLLTQVNSDNLNQRQAARCVFQSAGAMGTGTLIDCPTAVAMARENANEFLMPKVDLYRFPYLPLFHPQGLRRTVIKSATKAAR